MANKDEVLEAISKCQTILVDQPMMIVEWVYGLKMIMTYESGLALLKAIEHAEKYTKGYSSPSTIEPMEDTDLTITRLPTYRYKMMRTAQLLGISEDELMRTIKHEAIELPF